MCCGGGCCSGRQACCCCLRCVHAARAGGGVNRLALQAAVSLAVVWLMLAPVMVVTQHSCAADVRHANQLQASAAIKLAVQVAVVGCSSARSVALRALLGAAVLLLVLLSTNSAKGCGEQAPALHASFKVTPMPLSVLHWPLPCVVLHCRS